jgi:hypothetical protein
MQSATSHRPAARDPWDGFGPPAAAPARVYNALLGGKDNFPADRAAAAQSTRITGESPAICEATRMFVTAAVFAAARAGITQFIDLGCGLPETPDVHETARAVKPAARVVYVDADPGVATHSRAMRADELTGFTRADILSPGRVLASEAIVNLIDLTEPVMILMTGVLHWCEPDIRPAVEAYKRIVAPGSRLAVTHAASDGMPPGRRARLTGALSGSPARFSLRPATEISALFDGWQLLRPGVLTDVRDWPAPPPVPPVKRRLRVPAGIAVKP